MRRVFWKVVRHYRQGGCAPSVSEIIINTDTLSHILLYTVTALFCESFFRRHSLSLLFSSFIRTYPRPSYLSYKQYPPLPSIQRYIHYAPRHALFVLLDLVHTKRIASDSSSMSTNIDKTIPTPVFPDALHPAHIDLVPRAVCGHLLHLVKTH